MKEYDIIVLGGGPGGYVAAIKAAQMGAKTALIESNTLGGVCLNVGCIPTKTLLRNANVYKTVKNAAKFGVDLPVDQVEINWKAMQARKEAVVKQLTNGVKFLLSKNGAEVINGFGNVTDKNTVEVNGEKYKTKHLILATGSSPFLPPITGLKEAYEAGFALDSTGLLNIEEVPQSLVIVGGGVIGVEFATLFSTLGTKVTIIEMANDILINNDQDVRNLMVKLLKKDNVDIITGAQVTAFKRGMVEYQKDGKTATINTEKVLVSIGRKPNYKGIEALNLKTDRGGVVTDEHLETSIKGVYAIGDLNGKYMLAHVASAEALVAVQNIMGQNTKMDYTKIPACIYSFPEIASVGITEQQAKEQGLDYLVSTFPLSANGKALTEGENEGFIKIIAGKQYGELLGMHIVASHATDMISEAVVTMELEGTVYELAHAIHPHPTLSEIVMEAAHGAIDKPIHAIK